MFLCFSLKPQPGDAILSIDGRSTAGQSIGDIRAGIVGIQGSSVRIGFQRNNGDLYEVLSICRSRICSFPHFYVPSQAVLIRGSPEYFESLQAIASSGARLGPTYGSGRDMDRSLNRRDVERGASHISSGDASAAYGRAPTDAGSAAVQYSQDSEVLRLRSRVNDLENDLRMTRDELGRTRQLLDHDREASLSYVREIDTLQKKYSEQIIELQSLLNQSEKIRRELELQVCLGRVPLPPRWPLPRFRNRQLTPHSAAEIASAPRQLSPTPMPQRCQLCRQSLLLHAQSRC